MTRINEAANQPAPPGLAELFTQYLNRQVDAHANGLGYAETTGDAVPHDAAPVQPIDPRQAWTDALAAAQALRPGIAVRWTVPPEWPALVAQQEPAVALAFCLGNYPQQVRNLHPLLTSEPAALRVVPSDPMALPGLEEWASEAHEAPHYLLAAAVLRLARHFDRAEALLATAVSEPWQAAHANEVAALAWHRGQAEKAYALWQQCEESAVVLFNRGMAALFLGRSAEASEALSKAVALLPESSAWHHLGQLYRTLARW
jgi:tetratricopeptide (TPR) repeat protein